MLQKHIPAGKFKAECLKIMDQVNKSRRSIIVTKRHKPVVRIMPIEEKETTIFGKLEGTAHIKGDITKPIGEAWDVLH